ncbi:protein-glucosylgalactosylhydroxylysine glucosidase-like [Babylonia areolata]|uniref:protein-glucosylgalactosylhydroxylysine glucosidase-like n=1 Tax=Babylonia areolata TaxID=304850 RepID=UPI003FCEE9FA
MAEHKTLVFLLILLAIVLVILSTFRCKRPLTQTFVLTRYRSDSGWSGPWQMDIHSQGAESQESKRPPSLADGRAEFEDQGGSKLHQDGQSEDVTAGAVPVSQQGKAVFGSRLCYMGQDSSEDFFPCGAEQLGPRLLPWNVSVIETSVLPPLMKLFPEIGNGHVATVIQSDSIFMNGLYNGANVTSHRARIPSTASILIKLTVPSGPPVVIRFRFDVGRGVFSEVYTGRGFIVELRRYAHRLLSRLLVTEVVVTRTTSALPITVSFIVNTGRDSDDIHFVQEKPGVWTGRTKEAEYPEVNGTTPVTVVYSLVPPFITFGPSVEGTATFFTSVGTSKADAMKYFMEGKARVSNGTLFSSHVNAWETLWQQGRIEMTGNDSLALATNAAMYYLLSALPLKADADWPFVGMAPGGLAHGSKDRDYLGHVFWDQDTWMFPPVMLLHGKVGRVIVGTRLRTLRTAVMYANKTGFEGARYPWESAFTGLPTSPSKSCQAYEIHVTGDAGWMMRQYLQLTKDTDFLTKDGGYRALAFLADFWVSRSSYNQQRKRYEILEAMGPDEYHSPVNNSVYTNMVAVQTLRTAQLAAAMAGQKPDPRWEEVASGMYINLDAQHDYHPEFDGYTRGTVVKQADVVMLGFPFKWPMPEEVRRNDLTYYASVTPGGPAMTWSIFAISWLRLGEKDKADAAFHNSTRNIQEPFKVWSEMADGSGAYNFHTGMGGYLQSLLYGYLGADLSDSGLGFDPSLPPSLTAMAVRGVDYLGGSLDVAYTADQMNVTLTKAAKSPLCLVPTKAQQKIDLKVGTMVTMGCQAARIQPRV